MLLIVFAQLRASMKERKPCPGQQARGILIKNSLVRLACTSLAVGMFTEVISSSTKLENLFYHDAVLMHTMKGRAGVLEVCGCNFCTTLRATGFTL